MVSGERTAAYEHPAPIGLVPVADFRLPAPGGYSEPGGFLDFLSVGVVPFAVGGE